MPQKYFSQKAAKFFAVAIICLLLVFFNPEGIFNPVRGVFFVVAYPFQKTFYLLSRTVSGTFDFLGSISELKDENENLIRENNSLLSKIASLESQRKENESLREQLDLIPTEKFDLEASFVIGQDSQKLGSWLMIDKGSSDGIKEGMPVIVYEGILIGKVGEVSLNSSKISLLSDSSSAVNSLDLETGAKGIIRGEYGLGIVMDMVSQAEALNVGDTIITSGLGSEMPKGLLIGKVQEVRMTSDKLFQQAIIVPRVKYSKMGTIFVIKD